MIIRKKLVSAVAAMMCALASVPLAAFADDTPGYTQTDIAAHVYSEENTKTLSTRFYDDLPGIPYVRMTDFYSMLLGKDLTVKADGDVFTFTNPLGKTAQINAATDILKSDDYSEFINCTIFRQDGVNNVYYDGFPFVKIAGADFDKPATPTEIDFTKYSIDLRADGGDLWIPFLTVNDMFKSVIMLNGYYNGNEFYFIDDCSDYNTDATAMSENFILTEFMKYYPEGERTETVADFGYNEICFLIDTFYGYPGRAEINDVLAKTGSLDAVITAVDKAVGSDVTLKGLLCSTDPLEYMAGLYILDQFFWDGGHMSFNPAMETLYSILQPELRDFAMKVISAGIDITALEQIKLKDQKDAYNISTARSELWGDEKYHKQGSTVVYCFDTFMADFDGWRRYYAGNGDRPVDEMSMLIDAMKKADDDPEVKNFVIDISCNGGGSADIVVTIMKILANKSYIAVYNTLSKQNVTATYDIDTNFDGVFDEKDDEKQFDLNFGLLTSKMSFSCGNLLPAQCRDNGIPLFGDKSGGGACAVYENQTGDGFMYISSSNYHLVNKNGESIDSGIKPDYQMLTYNEDGSCDYSELYNLEYIDAKMNEFYADKNSVSGSGAGPENASVPASNTPKTGAAASAAAAFTLLTLACAAAARKRR